jgi:hypothetical protein
MIVPMNYLFALCMCIGSAVANVCPIQLDGKTLQSEVFDKTNPGLVIFIENSE